MSAPTSPWVRHTLDVLIAVTLVALAVVGALRWLDVTWYPVVVAQTAGPFVAVGLGLLLVVTLLLRRWWMLVPVGALTLVAATFAVPPFFAHLSPEATRGLTVMSSNLRDGDANALQVMDAVRYRAVDVLVLVEATPDAVGRLTADGLTTELTQQVGEARPGSSTGTVIFSRYPLTTVNATGDRDLENTDSLQPEVLVKAPGHTVRLKAVHPMAPTEAGTDLWRAGLDALTAWKQEAPRADPVIIAGDFNASFGHPAFRRLADGLDDAQRTAGDGWVRTWPVVGSRLPPYVQLDHLLSRDLTVIDAGQVAINGTDHAMVWASYAFS